MALGTSADKAQVKRFCRTNNPWYLKECDSDGSPLTTGDGTVWTNLGFSKGTTLDPVIDEFIDKGDGGTRVVKETTIEAYEVTTTLMQRDKPVRELHINTDGSYYLLAVEGATLGTQKEVHVMFGQFDKAFSYPMGGDGQRTGVKFTTLDNTATLSVDIPTEINTATVSVPANQMWATDQV